MRHVPTTPDYSRANEDAYRLAVREELQRKANAGDVILTSPNGTRYRAQISDAGQVSFTVL